MASGPPTTTPPTSTTSPGGDEDGPATTGDPSDPKWQDPEVKFEQDLENKLNIPFPKTPTEGTAAAEKATPAERSGGGEKGGGGDDGPHGGISQGRFGGMDGN